jgi:thiol-disulfide isomerase/thioredoxin
VKALAERNSTPPVLGLPARIGHLAAAADAALARADADGGGLRDALVLVAVSVIAFRLPELIQVLLAIGHTSGAFMRVLSLFADQARQAAWFVLPAAVAITLLARKRRDASRDLDLAAACYPVHFVALGIERALAAVAGPNPLYAPVTGGLAVAVMGVLVWRAVRVARARPAPRSDAAPAASEPQPAAPEAPAALQPEPRAPAGAGGARAVTAAVVGLTLAMTVTQAVWSARHVDDLRPMRSGQIAPDFALPRIDGTPGTVAMASLRGQVVVLDFWATWCPPCVAMIPVLDEAQRTWASRGVSFVGINSDGGGATLDEIKAFMAAHPIGYPVVIDDGGDVGARYRLQALPNLFVVGRDGRIRASFIGYTRKETIDRALDAAVAAD